MASFERTFLTIKVTKFASMEAEVLVITMAITGNSRYVYFIHGPLFANFTMIFVALSYINWLIGVQKHIQQEECDILPFSTCSTKVFNRNWEKNWRFLLTDCSCLQTHHHHR